MPSQNPAKKSIGPRELTVMMASLMALNALAIDAMLPAFPAMVRGFGLTDPNQIQYVISTFLAGTGIGALIYGPLSDRYGRKPILLIATIGAAVFSLACSIAPDFQTMLMMRFAHGLLAAAMGVLVVSVIRDQFEGDAMARRMSTIFLIFMIVPIVAPTIGQLVLLFAGWRVIFDLMAFMAVSAAIWVYIRLPETLAPENVIPIEPHALAKAWKVVVLNRNAAGYMIGAGVNSGRIVRLPQQFPADVRQGVQRSRFLYDWLCNHRHRHRSIQFHQFAHSRALWRTPCIANGAFDVYCARSIAIACCKICADITADLSCLADWQYGDDRIYRVQLFVNCDDALWSRCWRGFVVPDFCSHGSRCLARRTNRAAV